MKLKDGYHDGAALSFVKESIQGYLTHHILRFALWKATKGKRASSNAFEVLVMVIELLPESSRTTALGIPSRSQKQVSTMQQYFSYVLAHSLNTTSTGLHDREDGTLHKVNGYQLYAVQRYQVSPLAPRQEDADETRLDTKIFKQLHYPNPT